MRSLLLSVVLLTAIPVSVWAEEPAASNKIAIVIDDFGNGLSGTEEMMELGVPFTAAVMPFLSTSKRDAEWAHKLGNDVLVHLPMEPNKGKPEWLGPGAIFTKLSDEEVRKRVEAAIDNVPYAVGINNHMGSRATSDERVMRIILTVCKERNLLFLDSRTTHKSVIGQLAKELGVRTVSNNIFMDDVYTRGHIAKQALKVQKLVKDNAETVVIGHVGAPGKITSEVLKQSVPVIRQLGGQFVKISELAK
ncbi:divergent polysaccharide deacetylase family protein [Paenibacillus filicis]|uniref:Divergent polysaccharide deacetylase family protein n=1 Tax=Paenibacillus gyeongsangnamensis TaxID=3388067 RepID=A0ABT4Q916_9BACL|nr:divergent polysaccharide deacetylase family protein [Paenibacillus filicis]MCZ8513316.1 divergent polysaccharide deacetylase family protein [Paenibacillus filicis]